MLYGGRKSNQLQQNETRNQKTTEQGEQHTMKAINNKAAEFFQACINRIPEGETSCKLDENRPGSAIMALHIEMIGENKYGKRNVNLNWRKAD